MPTDDFLSGTKWWLRSHQGHGASRRPPPTLPAITQPAVIDEREQATKHLEETIERCIQLLSFSVEILIESPGRVDHERVSESAAIMEIRRLCDLIGVASPQFRLAPLSPKPPKKTHCVNCGNALTAEDEGEWCIHCEPEETKHHRMVEAREQREAQVRRTRYLATTMKNLNHDIREFEKKARARWKAQRT